VKLPVGELCWQDYYLCYHLPLDTFIPAVDNPAPTTRRTALNKLITAGKNYVTGSRLDSIINWARYNSLRPLVYAPSCCSSVIEEAIRGSDLDVLANNLFDTSPAEADLLIVSGPVNNKMVPVLNDWHARMPRPNWVMALGSCAISGGVFDSYACQRGIDEILPVDVYVPGCPPSPESILQGLERLKEIIKTDHPSREVVSVFKNRIKAILSWFENG
jgi:NADH-quinone oxidoreductase subunit B